MVRADSVLEQTACLWSRTYAAARVGAALIVVHTFIGFPI